MAKLNDVVLFEGETIQYQIEGNSYTDSPSPLVKMIMAFVRIIWIIMGIKFKTHLIATNQRIIAVNKRTILWGLIPADLSVTTINKKTVQSVGYDKVTRWFFIKTIYFRLSNMTENISITYKGKLKDVADLVNSISDLVSKA